MPDDLRASLYESGAADEILDRWTALLEDQAVGLLDASTVTREADSIATLLAQVDTVARRATAA